MGQEEIGPGASASTEKFAPVSKINRLIDSHSPPPVINTQDSLGVIRMEAWVGTTGTFSPDCLVNLTPGAYTSEGSHFSSIFFWSLQTGPGVWGQLRCLAVVLLEMPLLSTVITSPSLFTWISLGIFLRLFQRGSNSHARVTVYCLVLFFFCFLFSS